MLQEFLDAALLSDIGDEGEKFSALENAVPAIAKSLLANPAKLIPFTLIALDGDASEDEAPFTEVEAAIKENWKTLRNKHKEMPRQIFRAVIWAALGKAAESDVSAAATVWFVGANYLQYARLEERALPLCQSIIFRAGEILEAKASDEWNISSDVEPPKLPSWNVKLMETKAIAPNVAELTKDFEAAVGPQDSQGRALPNPNNTWPNSGPQWAYQFAPRAAKILASTFENTDKAILGNLQQMEAFFQKLATAIQSGLQKTINAQITALTAQQLRSNLLWWKETLFSQSLGRGYRGLPPANCAVAMACDLHNAVPSFTPQSVEFLLRETVRLTLGDIPPLTFRDILTEILEPQSKLQLAEILGDQDNTPGRISLLAFVIQLLRGALSMDAFQERTGLHSDHKIEVVEFAVWIFRDLQSRRCILEE